MLPSSHHPELINNCEKHGVEWAKWLARQYASSHHTASMAAEIYSWLNTKEKAAETMRTQQTMTTINQAKRSAFWTMIAAWATAASAILTLVVSLATPSEPQKVVIKVIQTQAQPANNLSVVQKARLNHAISMA